MGVLVVTHDRPGRSDEHLVLDATRTDLVDAAVAAALARHDSWISVPTADHVVMTARLRGEGFEVRDVPEWLMTTSLGEEQPDPPSGYRVEVGTDGGVLRARVASRDGATAATGQAGLHADWLVPDRITTDPAHRRRGLGRTLMHGLSAAARARGATRGVLLASDEGRRLYESLGWQVDSAVVVGRLRP